MPDVSIVITTRNRRAELHRAIESCYAQRDCSFEVLVYDDLSDDDTVASVKDAWPRCRIFESDSQRGLVVNRNRGFRDARGRIVVSLDDDAYFTSTDTVSQIVKAFNGDHTIGAIALPYIEPMSRRSGSSLAKPFSAVAGIDLKSYIGCAHAVRRDVVMELDGYREFFVHQHEERDLCIRLRAAGWRIVYGQSEPVVHMVSPSRDNYRVMFYGGRNQILTEFLNAPMPDVVWRIARTSVGFLVYRFSLATVPVRARAIGIGLWDCIRFRRYRRPVGRKFYREHRRLPGHGALNWNKPVPEPCRRYPVEGISGMVE